MAIDSRHDGRIFPFKKVKSAILCSVYAAFLFMFQKYELFWGI